MRTRGDDKLEDMDDSIRGWTRDVGLISTENVRGKIGDELLGITCLFRLDGWCLRIVLYEIIDRLVLLFKSLLSVILMENAKNWGDDYDTKSFDRKKCSRLNLYIDWNFFDIEYNFETERRRRIKEWLWCEIVMKLFFLFIEENDEIIESGSFVSYSKCFASFSSRLCFH